jgi:hypothetical protein
VRVRVTGYFFKKYGYASEGGFHKAPLLLAKRLDLIRRESQNAVPAAAVGPWVFGGAVLVAVALGLMVWRLRAGDRRFEEKHLKRYSVTPREALQALSGLETTDVSDLLRQLSEQDSSTAGRPADGEAEGRARPGA